MPATVRRSRVRDTSAMRRGAVVGALTTLVAIVMIGVLFDGSHPGTSHRPTSARAAAAQRAQLTEWEAAVHPLVLSAGQVVALGPRQGAAQLQSHQFSDAANQRMAAGWVTRLTQLRTQVEALKPPAFLADAQALLDRSLAGYVTASQDLLAASTATGTTRASLLDEANAAGRAADHLYDEATAAISARRAALGLPVDWSGSS